MSDSNLPPLRFYTSRFPAMVYAAIAITLTAMAGAWWAHGGWAGTLLAAGFGLAGLGFAVHFGFTWPFVKPGQRQAWVEVDDEGMTLFGVAVPWAEVGAVRLAKRQASVPPMHFLELVFSAEAAARYGREMLQLDVLRCEGTTPQQVVRALGEYVALRKAAAGPGESLD